MWLKNNRPIVIFAKSPSERGYLRNLLSALNTSILCFEKETSCSGNLASVVRTGSKTSAWRLILSINALKLDGRLFHLPNAFYVHNLNVSHDGTITFPLPWIYGFSNPADNINQVLTIDGLSPKTNWHGVLKGLSPSFNKIDSKALAGVEKAPCAMSGVSLYKRIYEVVVSKFKSICDQFRHKTEKTLTQSLGNHQLESQKRGFSIAHQL